MPVIFRHKGFRFFFYSNEGILASAFTFMCAGKAERLNSG